MYTEASSPRQLGDVARLISSSYLPMYSKMCLTFWYHMYGVAIGNLAVMAVDNSNSTMTFRTLYRDHGNKWIQDRVNIPRLFSYYKVKVG